MYPTLWTWALANSGAFAMAKLVHLITYKRISVVVGFVVLHTPLCHWLGFPWQKEVSNLKINSCIVLVVHCTSAHCNKSIVEQKTGFHLYMLKVFGWCKRIDDLEITFEYNNSHIVKGATQVIPRCSFPITLKNTWSFYSETTRSRVQTTWQVQCSGSQWVHQHYFLK